MLTIIPASAWISFVVLTRSAHLRSRSRGSLIQASPFSPQDQYKRPRAPSTTAVISIGEGIPSFGCIAANAEALGRFAASSQEAGLVPIVEPEVLMDGDHTIERCDLATRDTLAEVFAALHRHRVRLDGILLKPNMVLSGSDCPTQAGTEQVATATLAALRDHVPASVPGIVFLSGGQSDEAATAHLNAMNRLGGAPWELSFSYGRALQAPALKAWKGEAANGPAAQRAFHHRARLNGAARTGSYTQAMEKERT